MVNYDIRLPMYLVMRIHVTYPESRNVISEKNSTDVGKFLYDGAFKNPESEIKARLYGEWRDTSCPDYKGFLKETGIKEDQVSERIFPTI